VRRISAGLLALLLAGACSGGDGDSPTTTTSVTNGSLPPSTASTTIPPRTVIDVDACALVREEEVDTVVDDAGPGETDDPEVDPEAPPPALLTSRCAWPSLDDPAIVLQYLAPTTAADGPAHLSDLIALDEGVAAGGSVITQELQGQTVGLLVDADGNLREVAVTKRSALVYLLIEDEVSARDPDALTPYAELAVSALIRAPR
jgi:hypothetical protein